MSLPGLADYEYASHFGGEQSIEPGFFEAPTQVSIDADGKLLIADEQLNRIQICDYQGNCTILGAGNQPTLARPQGVHEDSLGRLVITESEGNRFTICTRDVSGECAIMHGSQGSALGQFEGPAHVVVDDNDLILIADRRNHRIQKCQADGQCTSFGSFGNNPNVSGTFWNPRGVALDGMGNVIIADSDNDRIQVCDYQGACTKFGQQGEEPGQFNEPGSVAIDWAGRIVVADRFNHRIQVCDYSGNCEVFGQQGTGPGEFEGPPFSVAADAMGNIIVSGDRRMQIFHDNEFGAASFVINQGLNDAWVSDQAPLQGFFFTVYENLGLFFLSWFTFDSVLPAPPDTAVFGAWDQRWVTAIGAYAGDSVTLSVELTSGGAFNGAIPEANQILAYGTITIKFNNCNEAVLTYNFPSLGLSGQMTLTRVLPSNVPLCEAAQGP